MKSKLSLKINSFISLPNFGGESHFKCDELYVCDVKASNCNERPITAFNEKNDTWDLKNFYKRVMNDRQFNKQKPDWLKTYEEDNKEVHDLR